MRIINIFKKYEYLSSLFLIIFFSIAYIIQSHIEFLKEQSHIEIFLAILFLQIFHFLYCIFLESEFKGNYLRILQIRLERGISYISIIIIIPAFFGLHLAVEYYYFYLLYQIFCPFTLDNIDIKLHLKRSCALYNTDLGKNFPYQYICTYDAAKFKTFYEDFLNKFPHVQDELECSKVGSLLKGNKVVDDFVNEYYKEELYYCDLEKEIIKFSVNPEFCGKITFSPNIILIIGLFLVFNFLILNITYFKNIRANIIIEPYILY